MKKFIIRLSIVCGWILLLFIALYSPKLNLFSNNSHALHVLAWGDILDPKVIAAFEKETGIKVHFNYYSSNAELLVKLKATKGAGYDLIIPSDYTIPLLAKENLLQKIDKTRLFFWSELNKNLLNHSFDPNNDYSIPFGWEVFLFGINKNTFSTLPPSWSLIFDQDLIHYKIAMINDPVEAILFASFYLFGKQNSLTPIQTQQVKELLIQQKKWVEAYASFRGDYFLATGSCQLAVASSSYLWRTLKLFPSIGFIIPKEGSFITIENLAIPTLSKKNELTYKLINYLFQKESVLSHFETFGFFPSTLQSLQNVPMPEEARELLLSTEEQFKKFHFIKEIIPEEQIHKVWIEVKSGKY